MNENTQKIKFFQQKIVSLYAKFLQLPILLKIGMSTSIVVLLVILLLFKINRTPSKSTETEAIHYDFDANFNEKEYLATPIYEPLTMQYGDNQLPESVSLLPYAPNRLHQGRQGSSVGWACSYAAHTILYAAANQRAPDAVAFSPAFIFNQIAGPNCKGAFLKKGLECLQAVGNLPIRQFNYNEQNCYVSPTTEDRQAARRFRIKGFYRLTQRGEANKPDMNAIRQHLAQGIPVIAGMQVGGTFLHQMNSRAIWLPTQQDFKKNDFFGHAVAIVGYDDSLEGGAFQLMNSWGSDWGQSGVAWIPYRDFLFFAEEVYSFFPEDTQSKKDRKRLAARVQILEETSGSPLDLSAIDAAVFKAIFEPSDGLNFKIIIQNFLACYIYIFSENAAGDSEVLFPYSVNHAAYCGIRGTRIFPENGFLTIENEKTHQHLAIVFAKKSLNWENVNNLINGSRQNSFTEKVQEALAMETVLDVEFKTGNAIEFSCEIFDRNAVATIIKLPTEKKMHDLQSE